MSEYTNNLNVVSTYKGEKSVSITGTFQCGIHFPKSGAKPFKVIERTSKNNKQYKQIACTVVISPDDRKNNNGNPFSSVYYDGKYLTFKEFLETTGVELIKGKLYAGVFMDRSTMGLYQVMGDPNLTFKQNSPANCPSIRIRKGRSVPLSAACPCLPRTMWEPIRWKRRTQTSCWRAAATRRRPAVVLPHTLPQRPL